MFALCSHPVTISDQELYKKTKRFSVVDEIKSRRRFDSVCLEGILQLALRSDAIWNPRRARKSLFHAFNCDAVATAGHGIKGITRQRLGQPRRGKHAVSNSADGQSFTHAHSHC